MNLEPLPQRILGRPILAAVRVPPLPDDSPQLNACFVVVEATSIYAGPLYVVYRAWFDGDEWNVEYGDYDLTWPKAVARLAERVGYHNHRAWPTTSGD